MQNLEKRGPRGMIIAGDQLHIRHPEPGLQREILVHSPTMMLVRHEMTKGWRGTVHQHRHEQMVYVISGCIEITVGGISRKATTGDSFIVESNAEHYAVALEDSIVLDVFTPPREDYL